MTIMSLNFSIVWLWILILNALISILLIILERKKPEKTIAWLLVFVLLPPIGLILYVFLGRNWKKYKLNSELVYPLKKISPYNQTKINCIEYELLMNLLANNNNSPLYTNNDITIFNNGEDKFQSLKEEIKKAKNHIHLEYYIVKNDTIGNEIKKLLIEKAKVGITVKFIIDRVGSIKLGKDYVKALRLAGVDVVYYSYFLAPILSLINTQINYRNHRKIVVIDGNVGFLGGMNIGDEYLNKGKMGYWRDTHILVKGDFVGGLQKAFLHDFYTIKRIDDNSFSCTNKHNEFFPKFEGSNGSLMQIIKSGPDSEYPSIMQGILNMITIAKSNIYITTPYFVPPESIMDALKVAALSGIDIKILVPGRYDHLIVYYASRTYLAELLRCGVKIYTYNKDAFIHSKTMTVDGKISTIGTANMDIRSFELDYEINAVIYDEKIANQLESIFRDDINSSVEMTLETYANTSKSIKCLEALFRVFSSLL